MKETVYREPIQKHNSTQSIFTIFTIMKYALFVAVFILQLSLIAQKDTAFIYTFGGEKDEQGRDIELTSDNGFIMVGSTSSFGAGNSDIYLVKVDSNIKYEWSAAIGHEFTEFGHAVKQTADNGYIICGYTNSIGNGSYDAYLVRTDDKGKLLWEKTYGGFDWDFAYDIEITSDGGFLIVGETHSLGNGNADAYLIKTDKDGNLLWEKTMGGSGKDIAHALISTKDGNFAFCGENASKNPDNKGDAWLVKFDGNGDTIFDVTLLSPEFTVINDLVEDNVQGQLYSVGSSYNINKTISDIYTISFDRNGNFSWEYYHGGVNLGNVNKDDYGNSIVFNEAGNLIIVGSSASSGNGGAGLYFGEIFKTNGYYKAGPTFGDTKDEFGYSTISYKNRNLAFGSSQSYGDGFSEFYLVEIKNDSMAQEYELKLLNDSNSLAETISNVKLLDQEKRLISFYPNPTSGSLHVYSDHKFTYDLYNSIGQKLNTYSSTEKVRIEQSGIYYIKYDEAGNVKTQTLIVE
jgi:hypothetical protein